MTLEEEQEMEEEEEIELEIHEKGPPVVTVKMGTKEFLLSNLKILVPRYTLGDPKSISVNKSGISVPSFYRNRYFKKGMDIFVDEENKIAVFVPNDDNPTYSANSTVISLKNLFNLETGRYRAEWLEEQKVLFVDLSEKMVQV